MVGKMHTYTSFECFSTSGAFAGTGCGTPTQSTPWTTTTRRRPSKSASTGSRHRCPPPSPHRSSSATTSPTGAAPALRQGSRAAGRMMRRRSGRTSRPWSPGGCASAARGRCRSLCACEGERGATGGNIICSGGGERFALAPEETLYDAVCVRACTNCSCVCVMSASSAPIESGTS